MGLTNGSATISKPTTDSDLEKKKQIVDDDDDTVDRETWGNPCEFFLSCLGYAVGFGNVWRFPYLAYKNGGAVFLIPYVIMLLFAGLPLFFMELALGQYVSLGPNILFPKLAPIFAGLGWAMLVVSTLVAVYYNVILAWTLFYTFASFTSVLPWSHCSNDFNSIGCFTEILQQDCLANQTFYFDNACTEVEDVCTHFNMVAVNLTSCTDGNGTYAVEKVSQRISASEDYFKNRMLMVTGTSWENMGVMRWELVGCLFLAWVIVCLCMIKGVKSSGKVVYFTALFPYAVLFILLIRGVTLPGAYKGIKFYFLQPDFNKLFDVEVWNDAATQIFYSLGSSFGGLITLASYNKFKQNCMRDAIVIGLANCATSVFAGFVIFSILGFMATKAGVEVEDVVNSGSGLAFVAYPEAVTQMPAPPVWALLFFFMLITLGLDSQFTMVETLTTAIFDTFKSLRTRKPLVVSIMCGVLFLCGLTMCLQGGIYMFELFNGYSAGLSVVILAFTEIVAVQYVFGFKNFMKAIQEEIGIWIPAPLYYYWAATWLFITPVSLLVIFGFSLWFWASVGFNDYVFPENIQALGWSMCASSFLLIPIFAIFVAFKVIVSTGNPMDLLKTSPKFCPAHKRRLLKKREMNGEPDGVFRYVYDNEGLQEGEAKLYPVISRDSGVPDSTNYI